MKYHGHTRVIITSLDDDRIIKCYSIRCYSHPECREIVHFAQRHPPYSEMSFAHRVSAGLGNLRRDAKSGKLHSVSAALRKLTGFRALDERHINPLPGETRRRASLLRRWRNRSVGRDLRVTRRRYFNLRQRSVNVTHRYATSQNIDIRSSAESLTTSCHA